jgi:phage tail sheath protein FI
MPVALTYPGVYIEELPSGVRTITGVATSITAFVGRALRGPINEPVRVQSFAEFDRTFGGLWVESTLGYAVSQFFLNGGADALIVRVAAQEGVAKADVGGLKLVAATAGEAGNSLEITIADAGDGIAEHFKLTIDDGGGAPTVLDNQTAAGIGAALAAAPVRLDPDAPAPAGRPANAGPVTSAGGGDGASAAKLAIGAFNFVAVSPGIWGQKLRLRVEYPAGSPNTQFNLIVRDTGTGVTERFLNVSTVATDARFLKKVLEQQSSLIRLDDPVPAARPAANGAAVAGQDPMTDNATSTVFGTDDGQDGSAISDSDIASDTLAGAKAGMFALEKADIFNLLCIPPPTHQGDVGAMVRDAAAKYCSKRRALYIVDPLRGWTSHTAAVSGVDASFMARSENAALFFPMLRCPDPLREGQLGEFAPCGAVAGVFVRTDAARGIWKAPAGIEAVLSGVSELTVKLTDGENGQLNPIAVNCLRGFPIIGRVVWGGRTLRGADQLASEWKYIPVRRLALYIEESLYRGTQWVVFEPNDEPLWSQIRLNLGAFMQTLFRKGAFQGTTPKEAYFVKCSHETTTQTDIDNGIVNIVVGFAPLKPAEFVVIQIQQIAQQP